MGIGSSQRSLPLEDIVPFTGKRWHSLSPALKDYFRVAGRMTDEMALSNTVTQKHVRGHLISHGAGVGRAATASPQGEAIAVCLTLL